MEITLILDSSHREMLVAVVREKTILTSLRLDAWQRQSEWMIPNIVEQLSHVGLTLNDVTQVIVGAGPGSYTGTRIALTIAKVLGTVKSMDIRLISSLHAFADEHHPTIVVLDARAERSYVGVYEGLKVLIKDTVWSNQDVVTYLKNHPEYQVRGDHPKLNLPITKKDPFSMMLALGLTQKPIQHLDLILPFDVKDKS